MQRLYMAITVNDVVRVFGDCEVHDERGIFMPLTVNWNRDKFDMDLDFGKVGEEKALEVFEGDGRIEVKTERDIWKRTRNIAIEVRCNGKLSGLSSTEAKTWIHWLTNDGEIIGGYIIPVQQLRKRVKRLHEEGIAKTVMGGDGNKAQMILVPIDKLF